VLDFLERSAIKLLKQKEKTNTQIADFLGRDRKTIQRALAEPADKSFRRPRRPSLVDPYEDNIRQWLEEDIPVAVMLQKARTEEHPPYCGGRSIFYQRVQLIRQELKMTKQKAIWRFEGLPGEYLQIDWGEKRNFPFTMIPQETRYCFVGRLKYSRWIHAEFHNNMKSRFASPLRSERYETFIRCLMRCLESLGGVPWVLVFDNMGTVTKGRNEAGNPIWNPKFRQFASDIGFHPELCTPYAPNQKGTVENGVAFVKGNFLAGRTFRDDYDLSSQLKVWLAERNSAPCQAHGKPPDELLEKERKALSPLMEKPDSYGLLHSRSVSGESVIRYQTNCYSVPEELIGQVVTVRVAEKEIRIYHDGQLIAQHIRSFERRQWIRDLSHYERTLEKKPRAKVMAYREKLLGLVEPIPSYISEICRRDRNTMNQQMLKLYALFTEYGLDRFVEAVQFCSAEQVYGASYVELMLRVEPDEESKVELLLGEQPRQDEIDRDLAIYDTYTQKV
jgi:transposase